MVVHPVPCPCITLCPSAMFSMILDNESIPVPSTHSERLRAPKSIARPPSSQLVGTERVGPRGHRRPAREWDEWCVVVTEGFDAQGGLIGVDWGHRSTRERAAQPAKVGLALLGLDGDVSCNGDGGSLPFCRLLVGLSEPFVEFRGCPMTVAFAVVAGPPSRAPPGGSARPARAACRTRAPRRSSRPVRA